MTRNKYSGEKNPFEKEPTITGPLFEGLNQEPITNLPENAQEDQIRPSKTTAREMDREERDQNHEDSGNIPFKKQK